MVNVKNYADVGGSDDFIPTKQDIKDYLENEYNHKIKFSEQTKEE